MEDNNVHSTPEQGPKELSPRAKFLLKSCTDDNELLRCLDIIDYEESEMFIEMFVAKGGYISQGIRLRIDALFNRRLQELSKTDEDITKYMLQLIKNEGKLNTKMLDKVLKLSNAEELLSSYVAEVEIGKVYSGVTNSSWSVERIHGFLKTCLKKGVVLDVSAFGFVFEDIPSEQGIELIKAHIENGGKISESIMLCLFDKYEMDEVFDIVMAYWNKNGKTYYSSLLEAAKKFTAKQVRTFVTAVAEQYDFDWLFLSGLCEEVTFQRKYTFLMAYFKAGGMFFEASYELEKLSNLLKAYDQNSRENDCDFIDYYAKDPDAFMLPY